jgi:hypothetical protein
VIGGILATLLAVVGAGAEAIPKTEPAWLVIVASEATPTAIARKAKMLGGSLPGALVVQTHDCGDKKNTFAVAADIATAGSVVSAMLPKVRETVKDAYVKRCNVVPRSLLSLRWPAVDASIADVPKSAVNWDDDDRVSSAFSLSDGRLLIVARYFVNQPDDPLEGRRERVILADASSPQRKTLENDCPSAGAFTAHRGRIAFECAREQAADELLHSVLAFDADGAKLADIPHCRSPRWSGEDVLVCGEESVGSDGRLKLRAKRSNLAGSNQTSVPKAHWPGGRCFIFGEPRGPVTARTARPRSDRAKCGRRSHFGKAVIGVFLNGRRITLRRGHKPRRTYDLIEDKLLNISIRRSLLVSSRILIVSSDGVFLRSMFKSRKMLHVALRRAAR